MSLIVRLREWLGSKLIRLTNWIDPWHDPANFLPYSPTMYDVALAMHDDEGFPAQNIKLRMDADQRRKLEDGWKYAIANDDHRHADVYLVLDSGQFVYAGIIISNIVAITAVPVVEIIKGEA